MTDINRLVIVGRVTKDPDNLAYTAGGTARLNLSIAVNRSEKKDGQWTGRASFFDVMVWGKQAENVKPYLSKGKQIAVDGYIEQQRWEKEGRKNSKVVIIANSIQLLGGKGAQEEQQAPQQAYQGGGSGDDFPEDFPF